MPICNSTDILLQQNSAPGAPGIGATWTSGDKAGVGTALSGASRLWYTVGAGVVTEVYYPTVDTPQIRDLQFLATDGVTFVHDGRRNFQHVCEPLNPEGLALKLTNTAVGQPYKIIQEILAEPDSSCLLLKTRVEAAPAFLLQLKLYVLLAPHLEGFGGGNSGYVARTAQGNVMVAHRGNTWLALGADCGFLPTSCSCGYVGVNDGWTDIFTNKGIQSWKYDSAIDGNIALTAEIDLSRGPEFVLALAFGQGDECTPHSAIVSMAEALTYPFDSPNPAQYGHLDQFTADWKTASKNTPKLKPGTTFDGDRLFKMSKSVLLAHEDKTFEGALVASLSVPWGDFRGDQQGGYHIVWPRDMCQSAIALMAAGEMDLPLRALIFLADAQLPDGTFHQNFYLNGEMFGNCQQLDEFSFPIILAYRLSQAHALQSFKPRSMVLKAAGALIANGPMTKQERWEENEGYSPSTLASNIAALICAASFADGVTEKFLLDYADFLESHIQPWTVTTNGTLFPAVKTHYIRLLTTQVKSGYRDPTRSEDPNTAFITIWNRGGLTFPAREVVDAGFLELVRYGIRRPLDPLIEDSLKVVDFSLKDSLPNGPCWRRYTQDGYGQQDDGGPFQGVGVGRPWPLLTGERGHYEFAAGRDVRPYIQAMEKFAGDEGLLAEQLWNRNFTPPSTHLVSGGPTGSARPLAWAHAEYIKLVRSVSDGKVFDLLQNVANRYLVTHAPSPLEVWNFDRQITTLPIGKTLRIPLANPFLLRWSSDGWATINDYKSTPTDIEIYFVDLLTAQFTPGPLQFTFYWENTRTWEGKNYQVNVH